MFSTVRKRYLLFKKHLYFEKTFINEVNTRYLLKHLSTTKDSLISRFPLFEDIVYNNKETRY